jgi:hypothetical protein
MALKPSTSSGIQHLIAISIFLLITIVYFIPELENKVLNTHDGTVFTATSKEIADHRESFGEEPLWTNSMFGGMPSFLLSAHYPGNLLKPLYNLLRSPGIPIAPIFLLMAGFYFLLVYAARTNRWLAVIGSIAYGFSSYFFILLTAGHNTKAMALAFMAPLIGSVIFAYRRNRLIGTVLLALFLSLQIIANHLQITYYTLLIIIAFAISELVFVIKKNDLRSFVKTSLLLLAGVAVAVAVNFASLYTTYEYGKYSMRGKSELVSEGSDDTGGLGIQYATQWSYGVDETLTFLIPNIKGGASIPFENDSETIKSLRRNNAAQYIPQFRQYWGTQNLGTSGPVYVGAIALLLFIMGLVLIKGRDKWWILLITLIAIMLAWGKNFMPLTSLFFNYFPGYNKFRAVTMILVIAEFCIPLLGILALDKILKGEISKPDFFKALKVGGGVTVGILILYLLIPGIAGSFISENEGAQLPEWLHNALVSDRRDMLKADVFRSLLLVIAAIAVIYYTYIKKLQFKYAVIALGLLVIVDMWPVNKRYLNNDNFVTKSNVQSSFDPGIADNFILQDPDEVRVLNLGSQDPFSEGITSYYHHSIGGYHGAKMRRYQDLISTSVSKDINQLGNTLRSATSFEEMEDAFIGLNSINMLNTKYIIINANNQPLVNPEALGNVWFVEDIKFVSTPDEELGSVNIIDPATEAVINNEFADLIAGHNPGRDSLSTIKLIDYRANRLSYSSSSSSAQLAVFSEIYYPEGWKATVNGENLDIIRANYVLRAAVIPPGDNEIVFSFEPDSYATGNMVSMGGSVLLIVLMLLALYLEIKKRKTKDAE